MNELAVLLLAVGLAMDAFAVSAVASAMIGRPTGRHVFRLAFHFGLLQFLMPILGWLAGLGVAQFVQQWAHWLAFALLAAVGGRAIYEAMGERAPAEEGVDPSRGWSLVALSLATSIDAFAVGVSFAVLGMQILAAALVIGMVTGALSCAGVALGRRLGERFGNRAKALGGAILLLIGLAILVEHLGLPA